MRRSNEMDVVNKLNAMDEVNKLNVMDLGKEERFYRFTDIGFLVIDFVLLVVLQVFCHEFDLHLSFQQILEGDILVAFVVFIFLERPIFWSISSSDTIALQFRRGICQMFCIGIISKYQRFT